MEKFLGNEEALYPNKPNAAIKQRENSRPLSSVLPASPKRAEPYLGKLPHL